MKKICNRSLALLLALILCLSALSGIALPASAATVEYRYGNTTQYSQRTNIIYNWGNRGTTATFLSPNAEKFYAKNNTSLTALSALSGSSDISSVPNSKLFSTLRTLMTKNHSYINSYDSTRDMFAFTDCQNSALTSSYISSFYSGANIGPNWDGSSWNREHTWPNSKGDANGSGENDIMMLRPASSSENSGRNNTAYGEGSGYYNPSKTSNNKYDLRGDVARIVLYVYVRWQDTGSSEAVLFGADGVIESKDVLLKWMEEDPVDTWEMGRNDSVESITGTRNVFVDYPELGYKLFGASVPTNFTSPSNNDGTQEQEQVTVRFMENGTQTTSYTVNAGQSVAMPAAKNPAPGGYSFAGWVTATLTETTAKPAKVYAVNEAVSASEQTYYALYARIDSNGTGAGDVFSLYSGAITEGDYIVTYTDSVGTGALVAADANKDERLDYLNVTVTGDMISNPDETIIWHIAASSDAYTLYNAANAGYAGGSSTNNKGYMLSSVTNYAKWTVSGESPYEFTNVGNGRYLRKNSTYGYACYASTTGGELTLYKAVSGTTYYTTGAKGCDHASTTLTGVVAATCTSTGYTGDTLCASCGITISTGSATPMLSHSYVDGTCSVCGAADPDAPIVDPDTPDAPAGDYIKVTSKPASWEGTYLIVYENGTNANVFNGVDAANGYISAVIADNSIAGSEELNAVSVTIESMTGGYAIKIGGKYISGTSGSNKLNFNDKQQLNTIEFESGNTVKITSDTSVLRFNSASNQMRFRYFKSTTYTDQKAICLYKLVEAAPSEPVASVGDVEYTSFADAVSAAKGAEIKLLADIALAELTLKEDINVDVNGHECLVDSVTGAYTVTVKDSAITVEETSDILVNFNGDNVTMKAATGYLMTGEENGDGYFFDAYKLAITHVSLDANKDALGYKAELKGNSRVQASVTGYGFTIGVLKEKTVSNNGPIDDGVFTLRLNSIMKFKAGEKAINAEAFVIFNGDAENKVTTKQHTTTMKDTILAVNEIFTTLSDSQKAAVQKLYGEYASVIAKWLEGKTNNIISV